MTDIEGRCPVYALLDNIRSAWNVGAIFRTADAAGLVAIAVLGLVLSAVFGGRMQAAESALGLSARKCFGQWRPLRFPIVLGAVLIHIAFWKALNQSPWWPGQAAASGGWIAAALVIALQWFVSVDDA